MNATVLAVLRKELTEYRRDKLIVVTMGVLPVVFLVLPLLGALALPKTATPRAAHAVAGQAMLLFLLIPTFLPTTLASYLVIGERDQGTLEPVLTTPVTDRELLLGKALAAAAPAVALSWCFFAVFVTLTRLFAGPAVVEIVWRPAQFIAQLLLAPGLSGFAVVVGMWMSMRVRDVRVAQQLSGLVMIPVVVVVSLMSLGIVTGTDRSFLAAAALVALIDVAGFRVLSRAFNRERLLTRYGASA